MYLFEMANRQIDEIVSNVVLSSAPCSKLLESDGISSRIFSLRNFNNKKLISFKDVRFLRNNVPSSGMAINITKNLDEYLYIMCNYVPHIKDSNFFKIKFQKIRILIYLFFDRLSKILSEAIDQEDLNGWIKESNSLLLESSDLVLEYRDSLKDEKNDKSFEDFDKKIKLKRDYFNYFDANEKDIDATLYSIYDIPM
jgi:hypothetical protein